MVGQPDLQRGFAVQQLPRRGLRREAAALYVGVSPSTFDKLVADGEMPKPLRVRGCVLWDVRALDLAFDALGDDATEATGWGL
jgi:predicted DNA-binding transcriptional regulator AlpA